MEPKRDFYEVLGVSKDADQRTIKRAFLKLARTLHPDVNKAPDAEARFKEVNEAYSVLSDERKRANYDQFGNPDGPGGFGSEYVDMSDIFGGGFGGISDIFDSFFGGGGQSGRTTRTHGRDMGITLRITLAEAAAGCSKTVAYDRLAPCDDCNGTGVAEGGHETICGRCNGTGRIVEVQRTIFGQMQSQTTCPDCHGSGRVVDNPCDTCQGEGRTPSHETVKVDIPAGIHSGQSIRVDGRGEAGVRGDTSGDLIVTVQVIEDERFERHGDDLYVIAQVDALEAMLGTTIVMDGVLEEDEVVVDIPEGCQYGQQVEVAGLGMPRLGGRGRGSLVVAVQVNTPTDLSEEHRLMINKILEQRANMHRESDASGADASADAKGTARPKAKPRPKRKRPFGKKK
ncbi:MAG: molecular chaperone DnaJ [Atopobiaceae bacterium]|nr:molecular chaperone DnaJ [Atopobiaceae bacterium]